MFADSKYSKFLTVLLIIVIIGIVGLLGYLGIDMYQKYFVEQDKNDFLENYETEIGTKIKELTEDELDQAIQEGSLENPVSAGTNPVGEEQGGSSSGGGSSTTQKRPKYKGFDVSGRIQIPKTGADYPILSQASKKAIEVAVGIQYGPGPNMPGNTVIAGHNYRNGLFFSNNKKLNVGDIIYITDNSGVKIKYKIYNKYETSAEDTEYMLRDTKGAREISLTTCTDNSKARLILWAKAE